MPQFKTTDNVILVGSLKYTSSYQDVKDNRYFSLFRSAEDRADTLINDLIASTKVSKSPQEIFKEMEAERREMEEQFTIKAGEAEKLREQEILSKCNYIRCHSK